MKVIVTMPSYIKETTKLEMFKQDFLTTSHFDVFVDLVDTSSAAGGSTIVVTSSSGIDFGDDHFESAASTINDVHHNVDDDDDDNQTSLNLPSNPQRGQVQIKRYCLISYNDF
jgi:hypothetical protein